MLTVAITVPSAPRTATLAERRPPSGTRSAGEPGSPSDIGAGQLRCRVPKAMITASPRWSDRSKMLSGVESENRLDRLPGEDGTGCVLDVAERELGDEPLQRQPAGLVLRD